MNVPPAGWGEAAGASGWGAQTAQIHCSKGGQWYVFSRSIARALCHYKPPVFLPRALRDTRGIRLWSLP
ncbi:hypothetical protein PCL1606_08980 [Pseudomonas chlororaphis]|uniref:Uncharacterized protein n=1 Tax=Pseudomonas chlororaphis TaxID=587753 RepID=A0A0D5XTF5_9PSED|nr:hypothetical protein PCL1606_08980 [Pseudomonas chlororaphis]